MHARYLIQNALLLIFISFHHSLISVKRNENHFNPTLIAVDSCGQLISRSFDQCSNETNITANRLGISVGPESSNGAGQMPLHLANVSPAERIKQAILYAYQDARCRQHFHMSLQQKQDLMSCWRYKIFTKKLLEHNNLEENIAWELWHEFVRSKTLHGDDLYECENVIRNELKKRSAEENRKQIDSISLNPKKHIEQQRAAEELKIQKVLQEKETIKQQHVLSDQQKVQKLQEQKDTSDIVRFTVQKEMVQDLMRSLGLDPNQCLYLSSDFDHVWQEYERCMDICDQNALNNGGDLWRLRQAALQKNCDENFAQGWQGVSLSDQARGYLNALGLNQAMFSGCHGTALQHEINRQNCVVIENIAEQQRDQRNKSIFLSHATQCIDASSWANSFEAINLAMGLQDLGNYCCDFGSWVVTNAPLYAQAMQDAVVESAWDFVHMVSHPREMVKNISKAAWFVLDTIALADEESVGSGLPIARRQRQDRFNQIHTAVVSIENSIANATGPERAKMLTKLTADCIFQEKALQAVGVIAGVVRANAGTMRTFEYATNLIGHEFELTAAIENIASAAEKIEHVVQKTLQSELIELHEAVSAQGMGTIESSRSLKDVLAEVVNLGSKIPLSNRALCEEVKVVVIKAVKDTNVVIDAKFRQQFGSTWTIENGMKKRVNMNIDHALNYEVSFEMNKRLGIMQIDFSGGHLAGSTQALEKIGLIKILEKRQLPTGCCEYEFVDIFTGKKFMKTEFHASWNKEMIVEYSWNLFENSTIEIQPLQKGKVGKMSMVDEKELTIVIKNHEKDINVVTLLPYIEKINL